MGAAPIAPGPDPSIGAQTYAPPQGALVNAGYVEPDVGLQWPAPAHADAPAPPAASPLEPPDYERHARTPVAWPGAGLLRRFPSFGAWWPTGTSHQPTPRELPGAPRQGMTPVGLTPRIYRPEPQGWDEGVEVA